MTALSSFVWVTPTSTILARLLASYIARFARISARMMHSGVAGSSFRTCVGTM